jgi:hypothetical protein
MDMTSIPTLRKMPNLTSTPTLRTVANFTSTPTLDANDFGRDVDVIASWSLLVAVSLGVLWAFSPMNLRCCTSKENHNGVRDLERASPDPRTKDLPEYKVCVPVSPGDMNKASGKPKLYFIDNIKIFLTLMVVITHTAQVFRGIQPLSVEGSPGYYNTFTSGLEELNQAYFMALFFLLSGYFVPSSLDRKGLRMFIADKMKRLGLPAIMWFLCLGPLMIFLIDCAFGLASSYHFNTTIGPHWFLLWLLPFSIMYALFAQYTTCTCPRWVKLPGACGLLALGLVLGFVQFVFSTYFNIWEGRNFFLFNPFFAQGPFYVAFFAAGIAAKRNDWVSQLASLDGCSLWALRLLSIIFAALIIFRKQWQEVLTASSNKATSMEQESNFWLMLCVWAVVQCVFGVVVSVLEVELFHRCLNCGGGSIHRFLTDSIYGVYLFHVPVEQFFAWTYGTLILEQGIGKELTYRLGPWCFLRFKCLADESVLHVVITTPIEESQLWFGWAYTTVLTLLVVLPLTYFLRKLPVLRDIL